MFQSDEGIVFTIDYADKEESRSSTATSEDSGVDIFRRNPRTRGITECSDGTEERLKLSCVSGEVARKLSSLVKEHTDSVLGQIHLDLAQYHESCRYTSLSQGSLEYSYLT